MDQYLGQISLFGFQYAPKGWANCNGQLLPLMQYQALFAILGTTYGGDGRTTFGLPDLRGRRAIGMGSGAGLSTYVEGEKGGVENVALVQSQLPIHIHQAMASNVVADLVDPTNNVWAQSNGMTTYSATNSNQTMNPVAVGMAGSGLPHNNLPPYLVANYCIALTGIFPSRN